ncbi:DUF4176 domain-containing protein [Candidatus Enterococcus murrayae]|uniref:DUF4176 domain-containing protein n=1 Tax=Candidatus Enterococcus murrayae TaxID=2815321 RepID=A0ABS3HBX4_9ENTE|nr:DUF4176 domain-containing protein [Enterococcus sp. MJM16]MBO0450958.1 DUF4176 domain-containing protein [Enterococcus sp. MJM16]
MNQRRELWQQVCTEENLEMTNLEELQSIGLFLGGQPVLFRKINLAFFQEETDFEYKPTIGARLQVHFDHEKQQVIIQRNPVELTLTFDQYLTYMGLIDAVFSEIYPTGSVIELNEELLSDELKQMFGDSELGLSVLIHGRRLPFEDSTACIDYIASLWPFGMAPGTEPIYVTNLMIKRVISSGLTNETEEQFAFEVLRKQWIDEGKRSYLYKVR